MGMNLLPVETLYRIASSRGRFVNRLRLESDR